MDPIVTAVREHYDRLTPLYRSLWGEHIHHGYWQGDETRHAAQENLTRRLAEMAGIRRGSRVLDIGCGIGGSALWLARRLECQVVGLTISPEQARIARRNARRRGLEDRVRFSIADANRMALDDRFDVVWIVESSEHMIDKPRFIREAAEALRPGGALAVCAWLGAEPASAPGSLVERISAGMLCPSLGSLEDYVGWIEAGGLKIIEVEDATARVARTWDFCIPLLKWPAVRKVLRTAAPAVKQFADTFELMQQAYRTGAMRYGMFAATKS